MESQLAQLGRMRVGELRERYRELFGQATSSMHKQHLVRRIAWQTQALAQGDISDRARQRALEIADHLESQDRGEEPGPKEPRSRRRPHRDTRLPPPDTELSRLYRGRTVVVTVLASGFECDGRRYGSLSAVARAITGTRWNGLLFFGLAKRGESVKRKKKRPKLQATPRARRAA